MIIAEREPKSDRMLWLVTQNDHAPLAAELLSLWRRDGLPGHRRRNDLLFAAREHDNGWREADSAPRCDPQSGRPLDFISVSQELRREIWLRGVERYAVRNPYAAWLIAEHAIHLHRGSVDEAEWRVLLERWKERQDELVEEAGEAPEGLRSDYRWIELSDVLSLGLCSSWRRSFELHGYRCELEPGRVTLDPFPLAGATTFRVAARAIPDREYRGDLDLATELATARWQELEVRVTPRDPTAEIY